MFPKIDVEVFCCFCRSKRRRNGYVHQRTFILLLTGVVHFMVHTFLDNLSARDGNAFTRFCDSVHRGWGGGQMQGGKPKSKGGPGLR